METKRTENLAEALRYDVPGTGEAQVTADILCGTDIPGLLRPDSAGERGQRRLIYPTAGAVDIGRMLREGIPGGLRAALLCVCRAELSAPVYMLGPGDVCPVPENLVFFPERNLALLLCFPGADAPRVTFRDSVLGLCAAFGASADAGDAVLGEAVTAMYAPGEGALSAGMRSPDASGRGEAAFIPEDGLPEPPSPGELCALLSADPEGRGTAFLLDRADGSLFPLPREGAVIGRAGGKTRALPACPDVSRRHAEFRRENGVWTVSDLGSANGTFHNGRRLAPGKASVLAPGDSVGISSHGFLFFFCGDAS